MTIPVVGRGRFSIGKYDVVAETIPHSMHMLRYTVYLDKTRIGTMVSVPTESDCRFMEKPPVVPPLKIFYVTSKPGRPKKDAKPAVVLERDQPGFRESLPPDVSLDGTGKPGDR
ncbi:MAG: hypothetical protein HYU76_02485 [Betaproteobacteria bacterium]|nr:hypothetical protein [Betaproteobacteria bacterium]